MFRKLPDLFPFIVVVTFAYYLITVLSTSPQPLVGQVASAKSIDVSVLIGGYQFSLFGYTSPKSLVTIEGTGIYEQTYSDQTGYFIFYNSFSLFSPREACLTAKDQLGRLSQPTCLPPFPTTSYNVEIGPVILAPTVSFEKNVYYMGDEIILAGQSIPKSNIDLSVFTDEKKSIFDFIDKLNPIKSVNAFTFPELQSQTDENGNFSLSIPSAQAKHYRVFAQTDYKSQPSNKSTTLNLEVYPVWMIILRFFQFLWNLIKPRFIEIVVATELIILFVYFLRRYFQPYMIARNRALIVRENLALLDEEKTLVRYK